MQIFCFTLDTFILNVLFSGIIKVPNIDGIKIV